MTADRVTMDFDTSGSDSILTNSFGVWPQRHGIKPVTKPGVDPSDTRILKSDVILTKMRDGGQEIESVETQSPGALEFIPNRPDQPHRWMNGERISIAYGRENQIQSVPLQRGYDANGKAQAAGRQGDARAGVDLEQGSARYVLAEFFAARQAGTEERFPL